MATGDAEMTDAKTSNLLNAAQEMYDALKLHDAIAEREEETGDDVMWSDVWREAIEAGRAAIAKAEGKTTGANHARRTG
jgi:hypothetical protein